MKFIAKTDKWRVYDSNSNPWLEADKAKAACNTETLNQLMEAALQARAKSPFKG